MISKRQWRSVYEGGIPGLREQVGMEFEPKSEVESEYDEEENPEGLQQKRPLDDEDLRLFLIRRTVLQMLRDRGYLVSDMELAMSREDFRETFGSNVERHQLDTVRELRANPDEKAGNSLLKHSVSLSLSLSFQALFHCEG